MKPKAKNQKRLEITGVILVVVSLLLASCAPAATPTPDKSAIDTSVAATVAAVPTQAPLPTAVPPPTQPPVPTVPPPQPTVAPAPPQPTTIPSIPVSVLPTPTPGGPAVIANYNTYIYSGPGTNYVVYGSMSGGTKATPIGKNQDGSWWAVSVPVAPQGQGWVAASIVTATNVSDVPVIPTPPVPPSTNMVPPGPNDPQITALTDVYVRNGPGEQYPAYGVAKTGQTGRVIGKSEDGKWWTVRIDPAYVGAGYGWVSAAYVQASNVSDVPVIQAPAAPTPQPLPQPPAGVPTVTMVDYVNVRSGPGTNYPSYGTAAPGTVAEVTGKSQDGAWWQIKIPTKYAADGLGWVSASYVIPQNTANVPVVAAPPAPPTVVTPAPAPAAACQLVSQTPPTNSVLAANTAYTFTWVIKNTGTTKWDQNEYDVRFVSATNGVSMHQGPDVYDLPSTVDPGQTITLSKQGVTPATSGNYGEQWAISKGSTPVCPFYVIFTVK